MAYSSQSFLKIFLYFFFFFFSSACQDNEEALVWFLFQEVKYKYDWDKKRFLPIQFPVDCSAAFYTGSKGLSDTAELNRAKRKYGSNKYAYLLLCRNKMSL